MGFLERLKELKSKHLTWKKVIKNRLDVIASPMSFRDPKTWWILSLLPQGLYTVFIKLHIRAKKVINFSTTNIAGDTSPLILSRESQRAPTTRNTFPIKKKKKKKSKVPKGKSQMTNAPLSLDWITSPVVPHWQLSSGRANVELTNSWAGEVPVGISLIVGCLMAGPIDALSNCWARPVA